MNNPVTAADWKAWDREQRRIKALTPEQRVKEAKRKDAERCRKERATKVNKRVVRRVRVKSAPSADNSALDNNVVPMHANHVEPQPDKASYLTQPKPPASAPSERKRMGDNEKAVIAQCTDNPRADERPATVMQARVLARILDDSEASPMHPTTSRQLQSLLASLEAPNRKRKSKGRLAVVTKMTANTRRAANE